MTEPVSREQNRHMMSLEQLAGSMILSFQHFSLQQRARVRKEIYEQVTGKVFRPNSPRGVVTDGEL